MRDSSQLTSESLSLFVAEGLLSRCDILGDCTLVVPGESASVLAGEPLHRFVHWLLFLLQPRAPVRLQQRPLEFQQVTQGFFTVVMEPPLELQWSRPSVVAI